MFEQSKTPSRDIGT